MLNAVLSSCLLIDKISCRYGHTIRVHYSDGRPVNYDVPESDGIIFPFRRYSEYILDKMENRDDDTYGQLIEKGYGMMNFILNNTDYLFNILYSEDDFSKNMNEFILLVTQTFPDSYFKTHFIDLLRQSMKNSSTRDGKLMHKLAIQLRALRLEGKLNLVKLIIQYFRENLMDYTQLGKSALSQWRNKMITLPRHTYKNTITDFANNMYGFSIFMADPYFLARIFRFSDSKQIIAHAHEAHSNVYVNFFIKYLGVKPTASVPSEIDWTKGGSGLWRRCITSEYFGTTTFPGHIM